MRVVIEEEVNEDVIVVYLDNGEEIGKYCIADDPKAERREFQKMLDAVRGEVISERDKLRARVDKLERLLKSADHCLDIEEREGEQARAAAVAMREVIARIQSAVLHNHGDRGHPFADCPKCIVLDALQMGTP